MEELFVFTLTANWNFKFISNRFSKVNTLLGTGLPLKVSASFLYSLFMFFIIDESILEGVGIGEELGDLFIIIELPPVCYVFGY